MKKITKWITAALFTLICLGAAAQDYPSKPVRILVGFPPGQATDIIARKLSQRLTMAMKQPFFVENKPGVGAGLAAETLARSEPDGYTILVTSSGPLTVNPWIYKNLKYDAARDFEPLGTIGLFPLMLVTNVNSRLTSLENLVAYAKKNPGKLNYASGGNGLTNHLLMEMFKQRADIDLTHVPYRGAAPALTDLMGGQIDVMFETVATVEPLIKQGRLSVLAVASEKRFASMPAVPTVAEQGYPGFRGDAWIGVVAPKRVPKPILDRLVLEINKIVLLPEWKKEMTESGAVPMVMSPPQFADFIQTESRHWGEAVHKAGVKIE